MNDFLLYLVKQSPSLFIKVTTFDEGMCRILRVMPTKWAGRLSLSLSLFIVYANSLLAKVITL